MVGVSTHGTKAGARACCPRRHFFFFFFALHLVSFLDFLGKVGGFFF